MLGPACLYAWIITEAGLAQTKKGYVQYVVENAKFQPGVLTVNKFAHGWNLGPMASGAVVGNCRNTLTVFHLELLPDRQQTTRSGSSWLENADAQRRANRRFTALTRSVQRLKGAELSAGLGLGG
jgi:hypothetical protein